MKLQKHIAVGGVLGFLLGSAVLGDNWEWSTRRSYYTDTDWLWVRVGDVVAFVGIPVLFTLAAMVAFWLLGHLFRFIRHQWNLAAERQAHKRLLKAKQLFDAGIYTELEYQAKLQEIKDSG